MNRLAVLGLLAGSLACRPVVRAQSTADFQTNIISGMTSNWSSNCLVGSTTFADALLIQNLGGMSNVTGDIGYEPSCSNNSVYLSDTGSVWAIGTDLYVGHNGAGNRLSITNGGGVYRGRYSYIGYNNTGSNNTVWVAETGSVWSTSLDVDVGNRGGGNSLTITNGGKV
jgi:T5SS/PEP-CTERM-associated repeat protein